MLQNIFEKFHMICQTLHRNVIRHVCVDSADKRHTTNIICKQSVQELVVDDFPRK